MKIADLRKHRENQERIEAIDRMLERAIAHDVVIGSHSAPDFGKRFEKGSGYINGSGVAALDAKKRELERENRHIEDVISSVWRREVFQALLAEEFHKAIDKAVENLIAKDWQPVTHGEWIYQGCRDAEGRNIYNCSECDFEVRVFPYNVAKWSANEKYCPHCGARMGGD